MLKRVKRLIIFLVFIIMTMTNISYAQVKESPESPYGPILEDLKSKEFIIKNIQDIKTIRRNLTTISITQNSTPEELSSTYKDLDYYIQQLNEIKRALDTNIISYKGSYSDEFFSQQVIFIAESYIISCRQQQHLIVSLQEKKIDAQKLFYSSYLIPVYYYLNLGDQMIAYIETYFVLL